MSRRGDEPGSGPSELVSAELARRLLERVTESLASRPVELDVVEHRRRVGRLLKEAGAVDHFELLGVAADASPEEIQAAHERVCRWVHPCHAERLGGVDLRPRLERLFVAVTEAYLTLADPERSRPYTLGLERPPPMRSADLTTEESRRQRSVAARECFVEARDRLQRGDVFTAIQLLEQAVTAAPRVEYLELLADLQASNPSWTGRAIASLERALELEPERRELRRRLAELRQGEGRPLAEGEPRASSPDAPSSPPPAVSRRRRGPLDRCLGWLRARIDAYLD